MSWAKKLKFCSAEELDKLKAAHEQIVQERKKAINMAELLEKGDLETFSNEDTKSSSLLIHALERLRVQLGTLKIDEQKRAWRSEGINLISDILRKDQNNDPQHLADHALSFLVKYVKANQGGLFYLNDDDPKDPYIEQAATYAYDRKKFVDKRLDIGDGIIGQVFLEKETIYLKDIPDNFVQITSGLGEALPRNLIIVPLIHESKMYGALELASFYSLDRNEVEFLEYASGMLASSLFTLKNAMKMKRLFESSQKQSEELKAAEEEMRQNLEEMQAIQENLARKEAESRALLNAIDQSLIQGEFDLDGHITSANDKFLKMTNLTLQEMAGSHYKTFNQVSETEFQALWQPVLEGHIQNFENKIVYEGQEFWFQSSLSPVKDRSGRVVKVISLSIDITESKIKEKEATQANQQLASQEEELRQNLEEMHAIQEDLAGREAESSAMLSAMNQGLVRGVFNLDGTINDVNQIFMDMTGLPLEEIRKLHYCDVNNATREEFEALWKPVMEGETINFENEVKLEDKSFWFKSTLSPVVNRSGNIIKIISLSIDITEAKNKEIEILNSNQHMAAQEEELRQNLEEMQAIQEDLAIKEAESSATIMAINQSIIRGELDLEGHIISANDLFLELLGMSHDEVVGMHYRDVNKGTSQEEFDEMWSTLRRGEVLNFEHKLELPDGNYYFKNSLSPAVDKAGNIIKVISLSINITEARRSEEEAIKSSQQLAAQEEELRQNLEEMQAIQEDLAAKEAESSAMLSAMNQGLVRGVFNLDGTINDVNQIFLDMSGLSLEEVRNLHYCDVNDATREEFEALWKPVLEGETINFENEVVLNGMSNWFKSTLSPVVDRSGKIVKVISLSIDITVAKNKEKEILHSNQQMAAQEEELRQNLEEMQAIQEDLSAKEAESSATLSAINQSIIRGEFDVDGYITNANDLFLELAGLPREEVVGKHYCDFNNVSKEEFNTLWKNLLNGEIYNHENMMTLKDGKHYFKTTLAAALNSEGKAIKVISLSINITEARRSEEEALRSNQQLAAQEEELRQNLEEMQAIQEDLSAKEAESSATLSAINQSIIRGEFDVDGHITNANDLFLELAGLPREEVVGKHYCDFNNVSKKEFNKLWKPVLKGEVFNYENMLTLQDGNHYFKTTLAAALNSEGKATKVISLSINITEARRSEEEALRSNQQMAAQEEELRQNLEEMQAIQEDLSAKEAESTATLTAINQSIIRGEFDTEGHITNANDLFLELSGLSIEQVLGKHYCDFNNISREDFNKIWEPILQGEVWNNENMLTLQDGNHYFRNSLSPVVDNEGNVVKVISLSINITEARRKEEEVLRSNQQMVAQEEELRQNLEEMNAIQETLAEKEALSRNMITAINSNHLYGEFTKDGIITYLNNNIAELFQIPVDALMGKPHYSYSLEKRRDPESYAKKWKEINNGKKQIIVSEIQLEDRTIYLEEHFAPVLDESGEVTKVVMIGSDVTDVKMLQYELLQQKEMIIAQEETMKQYINNGGVY